MKKMDLQERVNGFSFDYNIIDKKLILAIF